MFKQIPEESINIYCDESCHLEKDKSNIMVLGAIWCPTNKSKIINEEIIKIKESFDLSPYYEIKWVNVSPAKIQFYLEIIEYFFDNKDLHFRALIAEKNNLKHNQYNHTHDDWYYIMYFDMLKIIFDPDYFYNIYIDIKDTRGAKKIKKLHEVLCNNIYDFSREIIRKVQIVRSQESAILQLTDLLIGAISYKNRDLQYSSSKLEIIKRIQEKSRYSLTSSTLFRENKVNLFRWRGDEKW